MLNANGRQLLDIIGRLDSTHPEQGILLPADMPAAIAALEAAILQEETQRAARLAQARAEGQAAPPSEGITLRQRAYPFVDMLRRCHRADKEIVWGV